MINKILNTREKGIRGEDIACEFLIKLEYKIIDRNYYKKWGEIDIIAIKDGILHFFEVKSLIIDNNTGYKPEDNVHYAKISKLKRVIQTYLNGYSRINKIIDIDFKFHIISIRIEDYNNINHIEMMENVIL